MAKVGSFLSLFYSLPTTTSVFLLRLDVAEAFLLQSLFNFVKMTLI